MNATEVPSHLPHPWNERDLKALSVSKDFHDIGMIVLDVLLRLPRCVVMVSGPMTSGGNGSVSENLERYKRAMKYLISKGYPVFNQLPGESALSRHWHQWYLVGNTGYCWDLLDGVYAPIFRSKRVVKIVFMPNWESSIDANWEHNMALQLEIDREYLPTDWE